MCKVMAEAHSDDHASEVKFDATPWFEQASDKEIADLEACGWGGDYPADNVAIFMADHNDELARMFTYVEAAHNIKDIGFECHINEADAKRWLEHRKVSE